MHSYSVVHPQACNAGLLYRNIINTMVTFPNVYISIRLLSEAFPIANRQNITPESPMHYTEALQQHITSMGQMHYINALHQW